MDSLAFVVSGAATAAAAYKHTRSSPIVPRLVYTVTMTCSVLLAQLSVCEVLQIGSTEIRAWLWRSLTGTLLALLGFVLPALHAHRLSAAAAGGAISRRTMALALYVLYFVAFFLLAKKLPVERYQGKDKDSSWWHAMRQDLLAGISTAGITMMAVLCGISSITAPYTAFIYRPKPVTDADVAQIQLSIRNTDEMVAQQELLISRIRLDVKNRSRKSSTNLVAKMFAAIRPDDANKELNSAVTELHALRRLRLEMVADRDAASQRLQAQRYAGTVKGRLHRFAYALFAIYCVYRVFNGYLRMGWYLMAHEQKKQPESGGPRDALVLALAKWAHLYAPAFTADSWARMIGAVMSAAVFTAALSGMLRTLHKMVRAVRKSAAASALSIDPLLIAHCVGIYVLSVATVLRLNVPKNMSGAITSALASPLSVASVQVWNDIVLTTTSTVMIFALAMSSRLEHESYADEEEKYE